MSRSGVAAYRHCDIAAKKGAAVHNLRSIVATSRHSGIKGTAVHILRARKHTGNATVSQSIQWAGGPQSRSQPPSISPMDLQNGDSLASGCLWKASGSSFAADQQPVVACLLAGWPRTANNLIGSRNGHVCPFWLSLVGPRDKAGRRDKARKPRETDKCYPMRLLIPPTNTCVLLCKSYIARVLFDL